MKTNYHIGIAALIAVCCALSFTALSLTGCDNGSDNGTPQPPQRTFTIDGFAKPITVKDMRTGANDKSLEELGIIARLKAGLEAMPKTTQTNAVLGRNNLTIQVEDGVNWDDIMKKYSGNRLGIDFTYISTNDPSLKDELEGILGAMYSDLTLG